MSALLETLSAVERAEARLLAWGIVDGAMTEAEILEILEQDLRRQADTGEDEAADLDAEEIFDELLRETLLIRAPERPSHYRSRMAETVRLLARLRQLFPGHEHGGWLTAARLVADFRFSLQPRRYPTREIAVDKALVQLDAAIGESAKSLQRCLAAGLPSHSSGFSLSQFQVDAVVSILRRLSADDGGATVVTAGTGSGKTLAFYLPVLSFIASWRTAHGPQAIAIYPRNELLKDQLSQTYVEARRFDGITESGRPVSIGAFFGPTPNDHRVKSEWLRGDGWWRHGDGHACPYLRCPRPTCKGPLIWRDSDRNDGREALHCSNPRCDVQTIPEQFPLTRERMRAAPPDVLFTSTEMLNRNLSSWEHRRVFGLQAPHPRIALIDEAHTYTGTSGAQAAMLLRRWHTSAGGNVHFVGLSATLVDATHFFARLTGVPEDRVTLIEPSAYTEEGMEYQVALRGDPAAGTSLLSTTIQAAMALRRVLEPLDRTTSIGAYGQKVFAFTDDLDVTNRLYHALRDAEGLGPYRQQRKRDGPPLASLRSSAGPDLEARRRDGQSWDVAERLGHDLSGQTLLEISRTSSQDAGVSERSDMIVATAALEVGFNDPTVGAVIQHKAPRDAAAFLQRRGRAGRVREMRPWTVVTLSDFGRDRLAYEAYDTLFDPTLTPRPLPISNRAVIKMQATYAWMDWCARRLAPSDPAGSVWRDLAGPARQPAARDRQAALSALIAQTLEDEATLDDLAAHIRRALRLSESQVLAVLWDPPRSLVTEVLPTARRRLESRWFDGRDVNGGPGKDYRASYDPLPDFVPANLFSDLALPEVQVITPPQHRDAREDIHAVPLLQAMRTFAPGNVSLRFAIERRGARSWVEPPGAGSVELDAFLDDKESLGEFAFMDGHATRIVPVFRPWTLRSEPIAHGVADSSSGRLRWATQIHPGPRGHRLSTPAASPWASLITELEFHLHALNSPASVRRFAIGGEFTLRSKGTETVGLYDFHVGGEPAGLGFELDVDGFAVRLRLPSASAPDETVAGARLRGFRTNVFAHRLAADPALADRVNFFQRRQIGQVFLAAVIDRAWKDGTGLQAAVASLQTRGLSQTLIETATALFAGAVPSEDAPDTGEQQHGLDRLLDRLTMPEVATALVSAAGALWERQAGDWEAISRRQVCATIAAAVADACALLCPEFAESEVIVDLDPGVQPGPEKAPDVIWATERIVGGGGVIEEIHRRCAEDPRRFFELVTRALDPGDFEIVDGTLPEVVRLACEPTAVSAALVQLRSADSRGQREEAVGQLIGSLRDAGFDVRHAVIAALNMRLARPGASAETDEQLAALVGTWRQLEGELGIDVDAQTFAFACRNRPEFDGALPEFDDGTQGWRAAQLLGLLWPHGWEARAASLQAYNEFAPHPRSDRLSLDALRPAASDLVALDDDWRARLRSQLASSGAATLVASASERERLAAALIEASAEPLDTGALLLYPRIDGVQLQGGVIHAKLGLELVSG